MGAEKFGKKINFNFNFVGRDGIENYKFIQANSPDGGFLQSSEWQKFQESVGRKTLNISGDGFWANIVEHTLPVVGKYFYIPRGPVISIYNDQTVKSISELMKLGKKENAGWIRIDPVNDETLKFIRKNLRVKKAPHDMQPKELFIIDITKSEEELLSEMKPKTRYNIKLAQKHDVKTIICEKHQATCDRGIDEFVKLVRITAERDKITPHPDEYYRKMFEAIPADNLKLYMAEFEGKIIAANVIVFYGKFATYLHGASDNEHRNVMAPYLLQWQAMIDAKTVGCNSYDMGGVKTAADSNGWAGITRFKTGYSATAQPVKFLGSYDIVINPFRYNLYRILQLIKSVL